MDNDTVLIIVLVISALTAVAMFIFGIYQYRKSRKLEIEKFLYQKEQVAKVELSGAVRKFDKNLESRSAAQTYCDHIPQKFKTLDFTGLNALLGKTPPPGRNLCPPAAPDILSARPVSGQFLPLILSIL